MLEPDKMLEIGLTSMGALISAAAGAGAAVWFAARHERAKQRAENEHACNVAILSLSRRAGLIDAIKKSSLDALRHTPFRHLALRAVAAPWEPTDRVDIPSLTFLLKSDPSLVGEFTRLDQVAASFLLILNHRATVHQNELQLARAAVDPSATMDVVALSSLLPPNLVDKMRALTDELYRVADEAAAALEAAGPTLAIRLTASIPDGAFIQYPTNSQQLPRRPKKRLLTRLWNALRE